MTKFLRSGLRRDVCAVLAGEPRQAQALKSRLADHYDERVDPGTFYGALEALADAGFVETRTEGTTTSTRSRTPASVASGSTTRG